MKKIKTIFLTILISIIYLNCGSDSSDSGNSDTVAPGQVKMTEATSRQTSIDLVWIAPPGTDISSYNVTWTDGIVSGSGETNGNILTYEITGLAALTKYNLSVTTKDASGNESSQVLFSLYTTGNIMSIRKHYFIYTAGDLNAVHGSVTGYDNWNLDASYCLMNDIELTEAWTPLGDSTNKFSGIFFGNSHEISGLSVSDPAKSYMGLFADIAAGGSVFDLGVTGSVTGSINCGGLAGASAGKITGCYSKVNVSGRSLTGGLIGYNDNGTVTGCFSTGNITGDSTGIGGLIGVNSGGKISRCYSTGNVISTDDYAGGLLGENNSNGEISECFSTGDVLGEVYLGGLVGCLTSGTIINCYVRGSVNTDAGLTAAYNGGLVGLNQGTIAFCYSTGAVEAHIVSGGLVAIDSSTTGISDSFYDSDTSSMNDTGKGIPKATALMKSIGTFTAAGWDFNSAEKKWNISSTVNNGYPYLENNQPVD